MTPANESWESDAVRRLKKKHKKGHEDFAGTATFIERYNIPPGLPV
jgi:hypothetical protein